MNATRKKNRDTSIELDAEQLPHLAPTADGVQGTRQYNRLLITGCGRSGTKFMFDVMQFLGLKAGHEAVFGLPGRNNGWKSLMVEVSGFSPPFLKYRHHVDKRTYIVHQVRHPLRQMESHWARQVDAERKGIVSEEFNWFKEHHAPRIVGLPWPDRACAHWLEWNKLVHDSGRAHRRWCIEVVTPMEIQKALLAIGVYKPMAMIKRVLELVPENTNTCPKEVKRDEFHLTWDSFQDKELAAEARELAEGYGYLFPPEGMKLAPPESGEPCGRQR